MRRIPLGSTDLPHNATKEVQGHVQINEGTRSRRRSIVFAGSAAQAGGSANSNVNWYRGASDHNRHARLTTDTKQTFADDTGPGNPGDHNGRAALVIDPHSMVAGDRGGISGEFHAKLGTQQR